MDTHPRIPPPLTRGNAVTVVAPSGPVERGPLFRGFRFLEDLGFRIVPGMYLLKRRGYLAGTDTERLADLNRAISDPDTDAVFFARGGFGLTRILDRVDLEPLIRHPKTLLGFSDLTPLLNLVRESIGLITYLGPMVASDMAGRFGGRTRDAFEQLVIRKEHPYRLSVPAGSISKGARWGFLRPGRATGELVGGCLTLLAGTLGTRFQPVFRGKILFWEEVNEPWYRIDRLLTQLRLAGVLDELSGMIIGRLSGCRPGAFGRGVSLPGFLGGVIGAVSYPVFYGFPSGHGPEKVTLPLGLTARIDSRTGEIRFGE